MMFGASVSDFVVGNAESRMGGAIIGAFIGTFILAFVLFYRNGPMEY